MEFIKNIVIASTVTGNVYVIFISYTASKNWQKLKEIESMNPCSITFYKKLKLMRHIGGLILGYIKKVIILLP